MSRARHPFLRSSILFDFFYLFDLLDKNKAEKDERHVNNQNIRKSVIIVKNYLCIFKILATIILQKKQE